MYKDHLDNWLGRARSDTDIVTLPKARQMAATLGRDGAMFEEGEALPLLWHWLYFNSETPATKLGPDGHARKGDFLPPVELPRRMWAGGRLTFISPVRLGNRIQRRSKISNIQRKQGLAGPLVFVTVAHSFYHRHSLILTEEHDIVYRDKPIAGSRQKPVGKYFDLAARADWMQTIMPDPVTMFRYSALTFNGHRIHYDRDYCRDMEGYPGLVFHAPLTATLMMESFRQRHLECQITAFSFRALSPVFDTHPFQIGGKYKDEKGYLWAVDRQGILAMEAEIELVCA